MKRILAGLFLAIVVGLLIVPMPNTGAQESPGNISFQPSEIPNIGFEYNITEYQFELTWKQYYLNLKPFAIYNGERLEFNQIIPWIKNNYPNVNYSWAIQKFMNYHRWGYWLENLPQNFADNLDYLGFELDYNIPLNSIELEEMETYNFTYKLIHIGNKFTIDFYDLYERGFEYKINKTMILISDVKGKTDLDLDPITYSAPTITVTGFTEGTPCTFWDLWNASNVNGWGVVYNNQNNDTQYQFDCKINIGDGAITTWFGDTEKQVYFSNLASGNLFSVLSQATFRLGNLRSESKQTTDRGCSIISSVNANHYFIRVYSGGEAYLYSSKFSATQPKAVYFGTLFGPSRIWNCIFTYVIHIYYPVDTDIYNTHIFEPRNYGIYSPDASNNFTDIKITLAHGAFYMAGASDLTAENIEAIDNTDLIVFSGTTTADVYLINVESDVWGFIWNNCNATVFRQNGFNLKVVDRDGVPLEDVEVLLTYSGQGSDEIEYFGDTSASGEIPEQIINKGLYNKTGGDTIYPYEPYTLRLSRENYTTNIVLFNVSNPINWTIALMGANVEVITNINVITEELWIGLIVWTLLLLFGFLSREAIITRILVGILGIILGLLFLEAQWMLIGLVFVATNLYVIYRALEARG